MFAEVVTYVVSSLVLLYMQTGYKSGIFPVTNYPELGDTIVHFHTNCHHQEAYHKIDS